MRIKRVDVYKSLFYVYEMLYKAARQEDLSAKCYSHFQGM